MVKNVHEITHNACIYTYPDGTHDIIVSTLPIFREPGWEPVKDEWRPSTPREAGKKSEGEDRDRSARRARAKLRRLALANDFEYFVTLTLDPARIDRHDPKTITKALSTWADNTVRRHGLRYILIPEQHRDGAYHFHGFMAGIKAVDSGIKWNGRTVYNLPQWRYGFTTATRIEGDYHAAVGYCCKYVGKQQGERPLGRWYYSGGMLREPQRLLADLEYGDVDNSVEFDIPGAKIKVSNAKGGQNGQNRLHDEKVGTPGKPHRDGLSPGGDRDV